MIKSTIKTSNIKSYNKEDYLINLGFAENPKKGDLDLENFPSKIGGLPIWLIPPEDINISHFKCNNCSQYLYFLLQLYCPLEENPNSFHRTIYVFFCKDCWKRTNAVKVLRVQLPEETEWYQGEKIISRENIQKNEFVQKLNSNLKFLTPEYFIDTCEELPKASNIYTKFYDKLDEKSLKSEKSIDEELFEEEEDELLPEDKTINDENIKRLLTNYYKEEGISSTTELEEELENEFMAKIQNDIFKSSQQEDIFYNLFSKVLNFDPKQIVRYCRDDIFPLWFCKNGMLSMKNSKCKNCGSQMTFEFQVISF
jgi:pre-rRNA-processing protein TSR4